MEFLWQPAGNVSVVAHVLDAHYSSPPGLDFERDAPIGDGEDLRRRAE